VESARFSTSGLVATKFVGASASMYCFVRKASRCFSMLGERGERRELGQVFAEQEIALLDQREIGQLAAIRRGETAIAAAGCAIPARWRGAAGSVRAPRSRPSTAPASAPGIWR
jgi:hypothetical protein